MLVLHQLLEPLLTCDIVCTVLQYVFEYCTLTQLTAFILKSLQVCVLPCGLKRRALCRVCLRTIAKYRKQHLTHVRIPTDTCTQCTCQCLQQLYVGTKQQRKNERHLSCRVTHILIAVTRIQKEKTRPHPTPYKSGAVGTGETWLSDIQKYCLSSLIAQNK